MKAEKSKFKIQFVSFSDSGYTQPSQQKPCDSMWAACGLPTCGSHGIAKLLLAG